VPLEPSQLSYGQCVIGLVLVSSQNYGGRHRSRRRSGLQIFFCSAFASLSDAGEEIWRQGVMRRRYVSLRFAVQRRSLLSE